MIAHHNIRLYSSYRLCQMGRSVNETEKQYDKHDLHKQRVRQKFHVQSMLEHTHSQLDIASIVAEWISLRFRIEITFSLDKQSLFWLWIIKKVQAITIKNSRIVNSLVDWIENLGTQIGKQWWNVNVLWQSSPLKWVFSEALIVKWLQNKTLICVFRVVYLRFVSES